MLLGLALAAVSGVFDGSTALPLHFVKRWRWENVWLVFSLFGMILVPWLVASFVLPNPLTIYASAPRNALIAILCFGAGWGIGSILFGLGVTRVGMGLGNAVVISVTAVNGALLPLVIFHPAKLGTFEGNLVFFALGLLVVGIILCSLAARRRKEEKPLLLREKTDMFLGLIICIVSGVFSPCVNFAFAFGYPVSEAALKSGTGELGASVAVLVLMLSGSFVVSAGYCIYLLNRNHTWNDFFLPGSASQWFCGFLMGSAQQSAFLIYGVATVYMGSIGPVVGWPVYMAMIILTANFWGWIRGEWRGSDQRTYLYLFCGIVLIVLPIYLVSLVQ
jgi:L-rhamnose-H+ transport protein